jgi:hypothetical protein
MMVGHFLSSAHGKYFLDLGFPEKLWHSRSSSIIPTAHKNQNNRAINALLAIKNHLRKYDQRSLIQQHGDRPS